MEENEENLIFETENLQQTNENAVENQLKESHFNNQEVKNSIFEKCSEINLQNFSLHFETKFREHLNPILSAEELRGLILEKVYVSKIKNTKILTSLIKKLETHFPCPEFSHLKRVRKKEDEFIVFLFSEDKLDQFLQLSKTENDPFFEYDLQPELLQVPKYPLLFKEQYEECNNNIWNISYFAHKFSTKLSKSLTSSELFYLFCGILTLLKESKNLLHDEILNFGIIVNPSTGNILTQQISKINFQNELNNKNKDKEENCRENPLQHASMCCIDQIAQFQLKMKKRPTAPYLCTGYDLFILREPCTMCSMAILHSRFSRVIYLKKHKTFGGLGSQYKIHCNKALNHRFEVYQFSFLELFETFLLQKQ